MSLIVTAIDGQGSYSSSDGATVSSAGIGADALYSFVTDFLAVDGVVQASDSFEVIEDSPKGLSVRVRVGTAYVLNDNWSTSSQVPKYFRVDNTAIETLSVDSNGSGNPRVDALSLVINTAGTPDDDASNIASLTVSKGTPAASPSAPASPATSLELARFTVTNGASLVSSSNIIDLRARPYVNNDVFDEPLLGNDKAYQGKDSNGTASDLIKVNTSDVIEVGNGALELGLKVVSKARAVMASDLNLTANTASKVPFSNEIYDVGGDYNTSTYRFTAPITGFYLVLFSGVFQLAGTSDRIRIRIYKNGAQFSETAEEAGASHYNKSLNITDIMSLTAGDYLEFYAINKDNNDVFKRQSDGSTDDSWMAVHLLSI